MGHKLRAKILELNGKVNNKKVNLVTVSVENDGDGDDTENSVIFEGMLTGRVVIDLEMMFPTFQDDSDIEGVIYQIKESLENLKEPLERFLALTN